MAECMMPPLSSIQAPLPDASTINQSSKEIHFGGGMSSGGTFDMNILNDIAKARWLNVSELCFLLDMKHTPLLIARHPPEVSPPSGTLILYNRSFTRNYKEDHYTWIKKRNSTKVREDHVKLRLGGKYRVAGCYVHCVTIASMHRRAYHLLHNSEDGSGPVPPGNGMLKSPTSLVLVHYLDTQVAAAFASTLDDARNVSLMNFIPDEYKVQSRKPGSGRKSKKSLLKDKQQTTSSTTNVRCEDPIPPLQQGGVGAYEKSDSPDQELLPSDSPPDVENAASPTPSVTSKEELHNDETTYDDEALDILWSMVMEEGSDNVMQVLDNDAVGAMLESHASFGAMLEMEGNDKSKKKHGHSMSMSDEFMGMLNATDGFDDNDEEDVKLSSSANFSKSDTTSSGEKKHNGGSSPTPSDHSYGNENHGTPHQNQDYQHQWKNATKADPSKQDQRSHSSRQHYQHQQNSSQNNCAVPNYHPSPYDQMHNNQYCNYDSNGRWNNFPNKQTSQSNNEQQQLTPYTGYHPSQDQQHRAMGFNNYHQHMPYQAYVQSYNPNSSSANVSEPLHIPQERPKSESPPPMVIPTLSKQTPLPDIVDFTPEHALIQKHPTINSSTPTKATKVALSFSAPLPKKPDDGKSSTWHRIAVFAEIQITEEQKLVIGDIDLSPVIVLNPYSYRCTVPTSASSPGNRKIFITEVKLYKGIDPICEGILQFITEALKNAWDIALSNQSKKKNPIKFHFSKKDESSNIRLLTQLSLSSFEFEAPRNHDSASQQHHHQYQQQHQQMDLQQYQLLQKQQLIDHYQQQIVQQQNTLGMPKLTAPINSSIAPYAPVSNTVESSRKRNTMVYNSLPSQDVNDRHNKVRFVESNQNLGEENQQDVRGNHSQSVEEPQSPGDQPKLIQLLHVAQMDQK